HWVVFGLGNILSNLPTGEVGRYWPPSAQDGVIVTLRITQTPESTFAVSEPVVDPTWVDKTGHFRIRLVQYDLDDPSLPPALHQALQASLDRTAEVVGGFITAAA
ncbi:MAG: hypothetical protein ABIR68_03735, partial [Ilumatobacteraceae bacterium]